MPGYDRTGPLGRGSATGRGLGPCGRGYRKGFGRNNFWREVEFTEEEQKKILSAELEEIEKEKQEIEKRLEELK